MAYLMPSHPFSGEEGAPPPETFPALGLSTGQQGPCLRHFIWEPTCTTHSPETDAQTPNVWECVCVCGKILRDSNWKVQPLHIQKESELTATYRWGQVILTVTPLSLGWQPNKESLFTQPTQLELECKTVFDLPVKMDELYIKDPSQ